MRGRYEFIAIDKDLLRAADVLLRKVAAAATTQPAHLVTVAKLQHVLSFLPRVTTSVNASVLVTGPSIIHDQVQTTHWWEFTCEEEELRVTCGGHLFQPDRGGDSFTTMYWRAVPDESAELEDHSASLRIVPDLQTFQDGVDSIDLTSTGYSVEITDDNNPLLDTLEEEEEDEEIGECSDESGEEQISAGVPDEMLQDWSLTPLGSAEEQLAALVDASLVNGTEPAYADGIEMCDHCGRSLNECGLFIDGRLRGDLMWSNMCAKCFLKFGEGVAWGSGQLYARQSEGSWRMVAGFAPEEEDDSLIW